MATEAPIYISPLSSHSIDMRTNGVIINLADPVNPKDAATKHYVDTTSGGGGGGNFVLKTGDTMSGALAMGGFPITGLANPTNAQDAATKTYVDAQDAQRVLKAGDSMSGALTMGGHLVKGLPTAYPPFYSGDEAASWAQVVGLVTDSTTNNPTPPAGPGSLTNKAYVDAQDAQRVLKAGDSMSGALTMGGNPITGLANPANPQDAATKNYTDGQDSQRLRKAGDAMSGALAMGGFPITGLADPANAQDAATKSYVDTASGGGDFVLKAGDTMSGALAMSASQITGLADPTNAQDAATKSYADAQDGLRVLKAGDTMTGDLLFTTAPSGSRRLGCVANDTTQTFTVFLGDNANSISHTTNPAQTRGILLNSSGGSFRVTVDGQLICQLGVALFDYAALFSTAIDMGNNLINSVADPVDFQDAATKKYVDTRAFPTWIQAAAYSINALVFNSGGVLSPELQLYSANAAIPANTAFVLGYSGATWRPVKPGTSVQNVVASGGTTQLNGASDQTVVVSGSNFQTLTLPDIQTLLVGSTVTIIWDNASTTGQNSVVGGTGLIPPMVFAFGARAVYKLISNAGNSTTNNWIIQSISGTKAGFEARTGNFTPQASDMPITGFSPAAFDTINGFNTTSGIYTCGIDGNYYVYACCLFTSSTTAAGSIILLKNGIPYRQLVFGNIAKTFAGALFLHLNRGDTLQLDLNISELTDLACTTFTAALL